MSNKKIIAFAASTSSTSINHQLVSWVGSQIEGYNAETLSLRDYEMPMYSSDEEKENGIPKNTLALAEKISKADLVLISLAEHNGAYAAAFKNCYDWLSRIPNQSAFQEKPMFLLATSPGKRGGSTVLDIALNRFQYNGAQIKGHFSLPEYYVNFDPTKGITNQDLLDSFTEVINQIKEI